MNTFDDIPESPSLAAAVEELRALALAHVLTFDQLQSGIMQALFRASIGEADHKHRRRFEYEGVRHAACYTCIRSGDKLIHVLSLYPCPPAKVDAEAGHEIALAFLGPEMIQEPMPTLVPAPGPKYVRIE